MLTHRPADARGHFDHGWLNTFHTFSFAGYRDPAHMGFRSLRVINEDRVAGGRGFGTHGHDNMEIISVVLDGRLEHRDSMGNGAVLPRGEVQYMSAGRGIRHSEFNPDAEQPMHFYQIWIEPNEIDAEPRYAQTTLDLDAAGTQPIAGPNAPIAIRQDAGLVYARPDGAVLSLPAERPHQWVQVVRGRGTVTATGRDGAAETLAVGPGDGVAVSTAASLQIDGDAAVLAFDLA